MKRQQSGFTLIELVVVVVILGILAATAIPKFIDMQASAQQAAIEGIAGGAGGSSSVNFSGQILRDAGVVGAPLTTDIVDTTGGCIVATLNNLLTTPVTNLVIADTATNGEYVISGGTFAGGSTTGDTIICTLTLDATTTVATFGLAYADAT